MIESANTATSTPAETVSSSADVRSHTPQAVSHTQSAHTADNSPPGKTPIRLLLVEDSLPVRKRLRQLLDENPGVAVVAETGAVLDSIRLFHLHHPDTVLIDWQLEGGDCTSVLTEVKRTSPCCRVIVLTSFDTPEFAAACHRLGADLFLSKSRDFAQLPELLTAPESCSAVQSSPAT